MKHTHVICTHTHTHALMLPTFGPKKERIEKSQAYYMYLIRIALCVSI